MDLPSLFASIGIERDYSGLDLDGFDVDLQGWGSGHPIFDRLLRDVRPSVVIELGTWKGASLLRMHGIARELELTTAFVSVDTWLGSSAHWLDDEIRPSLRIVGGYPSLYRQFIANVLAHDAAEDVYPLPLPTAAAAVVLGRMGVTADLIYIDASHEEQDVARDLELYVQLLRPGGVLFGDDYHARWPGVVTAVDRFARAHSKRVEVDGHIWLLRF